MRTVTHERCLAALEDYAADASRRGVHPGLVGYEALAAKRGWPSRSSVTARLGPWTEALDRAGVSSARSSVRNRSWVGAVRDYVEEMHTAKQYPAAQGYRDRAAEREWPSLGTVIACAGSWSSALVHAGFENPRKTGRHWVTSEDCVAAIRCYVSRMAALGTYPGTVGYDAMAKECGWPDRQHSVIPRLGSWAEALKAAGFNGRIRKRPQTISAEQCIAALEVYVAEAAAAHRRPTASGYAAAASARGWPALSTVLARFGTWTAAVAATPRAEERTGPDLR